MRNLIPWNGYSFSKKQIIYADVGSSLYHQQQPSNLNNLGQQTTPSKYSLMWPVKHESISFLPCQRACLLSPPVCHRGLVSLVSNVVSRPLQIPRQVWSWYCTLQNLPLDSFQFKVHISLLMTSQILVHD